MNPVGFYEDLCDIINKHSIVGGVVVHCFVAGGLMADCATGYPSGVRKSFGKSWLAKCLIWEVPVVVLIANSFEQWLTESTEERSDG